MLQSVDDKGATHARFDKRQLKSIVERIENLESQRKSIKDDIDEIYSEAKGGGYDVKALRSLIRLRAQDPNERAEVESILEIYMHEMGMI